MKSFFRVVKAEALKQHKNYFHNKTIYISLFLWPLLSFVSAYFGYKPFAMEKVAGSVDYVNEENLILFVLIGYLCMIFFRSLVQSAWMFSHERIYGTLELIYLSPANRLAFVLGNCLSSLFESVWLFIVFEAGLFVIRGNQLHVQWEAAVLGIVMMILMAMLWGMLLNALFLFSRDTNFLFTVLEEPMELFAGIKIPSTVFPVWARAISSIFPLTYSAETLRRVMLRGDGLYQLRGYFLISLLFAGFMLGITMVCLRLGERHARKTGNMALF